MLKFPKHVSIFEKATVVIIGFFLLVCIVTQLFFDGNVLRFSAILAVSELVFSWLVFWPEAYEFRETSLVIVTAKQKVRREIPYHTIFDLETVGRFRDAKKDADTVEVILIYVPEGKTIHRSVSCHPKNVHDFVKELQARCPNLFCED